MERLPRDLAVCGTFALVSGLVLWPPGAVYWTAVATVVGEAPTIGLVLLVPIALLFGVAVLAVGALARVPVVTYLRYHALLVLGDVEESFDVLADRRPLVADP